MSNLRTLVKELYKSGESAHEYWLVDHVARDPELGAFANLGMLIYSAPTKNPSHIQNIRLRNPLISCGKGSIEETMKEDFDSFNYKLFFIATQLAVPLYNGPFKARESEFIRNLFERSPSKNKIEGPYLFSGEGYEVTFNNPDAEMKLQGGLTDIQKSGGKLFPSYNGDFSIILSSDINYVGAPGNKSIASAYDVISASVTYGVDFRKNLLNTMNAMPYVVESFLDNESTTKGTMVLIMDRKDKANKKDKQYHNKK